MSIHLNSYLFYRIPESQEIFTTRTTFGVTVIFSVEHLGNGLPPPGCTAYSPGGSIILYAPFLSVFTVAKGELFVLPTTIIYTVISYTLSAHSGSGGFLITGHTGPSVTFPCTPES